MSFTPKLSFIVLSYNYADLIEQTIRSILDQTVQDFEVLVVDDASTDTSREVVRSFADPRIRLLVNERNLGGAASYNRAVQAARGEYLVNVDADDWIAPNKCELQLAFLARSKVAVLGSYADFVDWDGRPSPRAAELELHTNRPFDLNAVDSWIGANRLVRSSTMVERAAHLAVGPDDPSMVRAPDYELWTRFLRAGYRFAVVPEKLAFYRVHGGGVTNVEPVGTFLEMAYAALRNLVPLIERQAVWPSFSCIIEAWIRESAFKAMRPVERYRLLGMLLTAPPPGDFAAFLRAVCDVVGQDPVLVTAGRRLLAQYSQMANVERRLYSDIAAKAEQVAMLQERVAEVSYERDQILQSTLWKASEPLRQLGIRHPGVARRLRQLLKATWWSVRLALPARLRDVRERRRAAALAMPIPVPSQLTALPRGPEPDVRPASDGEAALEPPAQLTPSRASRL